MVELNWTIVAVDVHPQQDAFENVIHTVHWLLQGVDGELRAKIVGTQVLTTDKLTKTKFKAFDKVCQDKTCLLKWLHEAMGDETVQHAIDTVKAALEQQKAPKTNYLLNL